MSSEQSIEIADSRGRALRAVFTRRGDRVAHRIEVVEQGRAIPLLESLEGDADDQWPPSPPLQQLSVETIAAQRVALLVGMAGRSHWSMSVEPHRQTPALVFDVACRSGGGGRLQSAYGVLDSQASELVCCEPVESGAAEALLERTAEKWLVQPRWQPSAGPARWKYRLRLR